MPKIRHVNVGTGIETLEEWMHVDTHEIDVEAEGVIVVSIPPSGYHRLLNVYGERLSENHYKVHFEFNSEPEP